jgi:type IV pilus assembly protein PilC
MVEGVIEADSRHAAKDALCYEDLDVVELRADRRRWLRLAAGHVIPLVKVRSSRGRSVSADDLGIFCRQLSVSVSAGVPLKDALELLAEEADHPRLAAAVRRVLRDLHNGLAFSEAMGRESKLFGPLFGPLIRSAEEAGSLPQTLEYLATHLEKGEHLRRRIHSVAAYPLFVMIFFVIVSTSMTFAVLPRFQAIFGEFGSELPLLTRAVFSVNGWMADHILMLLLSAAAVVGAGVLYAKTPVGRLQRDTLLLRLPLVGECLRKSGMARFCGNLATMLRGGVPVLAALQVTTDVLGNRALQRSLDRAVERIVAGEAIGLSLAREASFPKLVARMVGVGEQSGQLPEVLEKVTTVYEGQVEKRVMIILSLFEPVFIALCGAFILLMVLAIYVPIFTVSSHM